MKSVIPAFSPIPPPPSFNGSSVADHPPPKAPFPEQPTAVAPLQSSLGLPERPPLEEPPSVQLPEPPLEPYPGQAEPQHQEPTGQNAYAANSGLKSESSGGFSKMKTMLEARMGLSGSRESLPNGDGSESSEAAMPKFDSRSPSASPQVHVQLYFWL